VTSDAALLAAMNDELDHIELASAGGQAGGVEVRLCDCVCVCVRVRGTLGGGGLCVAVCGCV
jgi:hypothetical protein